MWLTGGTFVCKYSAHTKKKKKLSDRGDETRNDLALTFSNSSECVYLCVLNECLIGLHVLELEPLTWTLCPVVSRLQVCFLFYNEENRWERGLLVLIYPGGSLGITINSQLRPHSLSPHRHCQFVPIRECSFRVSDVRGWSGRTAEQPSRACFGPDLLLYFQIYRIHNLGKSFF